MSHTTTAYSALESLLLFQALRTDGVTQISFNRISDQLKSIPLIRNAPDYDGGRLSPDALRELYLGLLKEEVKHDLDQQHQATGAHSLTNGDVSPASRKRKAASPSLPTVREAAQHSHLIPQLVSRLYTRYRDHTLGKLKTQTNQHASLRQEIRQIEAGEWDEKLQRKRAVSETKSPKPSSTAHTQPIVARPSNPQPSPSMTSTPVPVPLKASENGPKTQPKRYTQAKIDTMINHGPEPQNSPGGHRRASSNTTLPPLSEMAPQSPHLGLPPKASAPLPMQPMPSTLNNTYAQSPPAGNQSPHNPPHGHPRPGSIASPQLQQSVSRPSSSPRPVLPPPKGMPFAPPTTGPHIGSPGLHAPPLLPQQHHPPPQPMQQQYQQPNRLQSGSTYKADGNHRHPGTPVAHQPGVYYPPQQQYGDRRTSYPPPQGPSTPTYPPGGYMLPPFQIQQQEHPKPAPPQQQLRPQHPPAIAQRPPSFSSHAPIAPATGPRPVYPQNPQMSMVVNALATPLRSRSKAKSLWKSSFPSTSDQSPRPRPVIEPLSPKLERAKLSTRAGSNRNREVPTLEVRPSMEAPSKGRSGKRRANARDRSPHSVVSSAADESLRARTRSHSVSTAAGKDLYSDDRPASRNGVKAEPSTPADMMDDAEPTPVSATSNSGMMTRKRRGTIQSLPAPPAKRKRNESPSTVGEDLAEPPPRSNTIIATRNFSKMSSAIMNDITSHKHASYFAKEVRDKDAPGYSKIVKRPQNLKSIRSAITAGARAIATASTTLESPSATTANSSTTVELERSVDLIPPKAIVNGAQLEKELTRMCANAYMFNPGEDGMALTTKEMFEDVEQKISDWRGTEREAGADEDDGGQKRRKV